MSKLAARIAAMRQVTAQADNTSTTSEARNPTSLETYVRLYNKCTDGVCYIDYMEGAKLLHTYLSPISIPHRDLYPNLLTGCRSIPALMDAYAIQRLTLILAGPEGFQAENFNYIQSLVVYYTAKHILEEITL